MDSFDKIPCYRSSSPPFWKIPTKHHPLSLRLRVTLSWIGLMSQAGGGGWGGPSWQFSCQMAMEEPSSCCRLVAFESKKLGICPRYVSKSRVKRYLKYRGGFMVSLEANGNVFWKLPDLQTHTNCHWVPAIHHSMYSCRFYIMMS